MGNINAPAIKNPHDPSCRHVMMCVNHAAIIVIKNSAPNSDGIVFLRLAPVKGRGWFK